ncbi:DUF7144 family membrane protein [Actinacidiphila sp. bgisy167]|uniref:DUF7144 family membrane protein n=1 Tax=Actinacidiphila sp. bgisy167 TaxID=3413797 RepID=UPI003D7433BE
MTQQTQWRMERPHSGLAAGGTTFAGVLLLVSGVVMIFEGISAIAQDDIWVGLGDYVFKFNLTAWGWIHLVLGVLVIVVGAALLQNAPDWARVVGVALAAFNIIVNFVWLPYIPVWAVIVIAIDVFVIWALCRSWGEHPGRE